MPGKYAYSKFRIVLLMFLLGAAIFIVSDASIGQTTAPAAAAADAPSEAKGLLTLIFSHLDPVFFTIAILSVIGLTLIIQGFIKTRSSVMMPEEVTQQMRTMIENRQFKELIEYTENEPSFVAKALNPALKRAPSFASMKEAMETSVGEQTAEQFRKIEFLNIIGNLGPLLGLLGTVLGMIYAFQEVAAKKGQADVSALSFGISTALTHTFLGLALAVPCLAAFGVLRTMVDRLTVRGALIAEELLLMIKPQDARQGAAGTVASPTVPGRATPQPSIPVPQVRKP